MVSECCSESHLDAVVSTDGDADRPMLTDETGAIVPGDVLGVLTARMLAAEAVVTPVSSNSMASDGLFDRVILTRIGSPFVIAGMEALGRERPHIRVVGFEANGGFLLGFTAQGPAGPLPALATRDAILPILAPLAAARLENLSLTALRAMLPTRFTAADRLQNVSSVRARDFLGQLSADAAERAAFCHGWGEIVDIDETDGLRLTFDTEDIVHLRPSGNAPEFRVYTEANTSARAQMLAATVTERVAAELG